LITASIDKPGIMPEQKHCVRGFIYIDGWTISPLLNNPSQSVLTYISEVDLGGAIPEFAIT